MIRIGREYFVHPSTENVCIPTNPSDEIHDISCLISCLQMPNMTSICGEVSLGIFSVFFCFYFLINTLYRKLWLQSLY